MVSSLIPIDLGTFLSYTRYGTFFEVRRVAFDALLLLDGMKNPDISGYILNTLGYDPDSRIRYHLASSLARLVSLKTLNHQLTRERNPDDPWTYVDPSYFANQDVSRFIWGVLT